MTISEDFARWLHRLPPAEQIAFRRQEEQAAGALKRCSTAQAPRECSGPHPEGSRRATGKGLCDAHRDQLKRGETLRPLIIRRPCHHASCKDTFTP